MQAYLAGLADAVGRVRIRETAQGTRLAELTISSPDLGLVGYCARLTGVRAVTVRRDYQRMGCGEHCEEPHLHVESTTARCQLVGARAVIVLRAIRPYLHRLGPAVDSVLATCGDAPVKPATVRKMAELGWT